MMLAHADLTIEWFETPSHLKVYIQDSEGKPINGAVVSSTSQPSGQPTLTGTIGDNGSLPFSDVEPGSYTFQASKSGYLTKSGSGSVSVGETTELVITLEIEPEPEVEKTGNGGIPGFPYESIILGLMIGVFILWLLHRKR